MQPYLDRQLQRDLLLKIQATNSLDPIRSEQLFKGIEDPDKAAFNLQYLEQHGLVVNHIVHMMDMSQFVSTRITAKGLDFLADDGGLSAVFGVVTIKLHSDTLQSLLEGKIRQAEIPPEEQNSLIQKLKSLPSEALGQIATKLVDLAFDQSSTAIPQLCKWLGQIAT